jgi:hypothetical protein
MNKKSFFEERLKNERNGYLSKFSAAFGGMAFII